MHFIHLLNPYGLDSANPLAVGTQQREASAKFVEMIANSKMNYWRPGMLVFDKGIRLLIGLAASFDIKDLRIADLIERHYDGEGSVQIDVFNIDDCRNIEDLHSYYPQKFDGAPNTPIVGIWTLGIFSSAVYGHEARMCILDFLGLKPDIQHYFGDLSPLSKQVFEET